MLVMFLILVSTVAYAVEGDVSPEEGRQIVTEQNQSAHMGF